MTIVEAINNYTKIRRLVPRHLGSGGDGWLDSGYVLSLMIPKNNYFNDLNLDYDFPINADDILADDWQGSDPLKIGEKRKI